MKLFVPLAALVGWTLVGAQPSAQDGPSPLPPELSRGGPSPEDELRRLFIEVETTLRRIDDRLFDAAAGEAELGAADAEINRLLRETEAASQAAVAGIDQILQVAQSMNQSGGGQGSSSGGRNGQQSSQSQGQSPLDGAQPPERQERMQGEQPPQLDPTGSEPEPAPEPGGQQPGDSPTERSDEQSAPGTDPARGEAGPGSSPEGSGRWGDLPPRVQTIFQNQVDDDLPARYREWIDRYHRRLNG